MARLLDSVEQSLSTDFAVLTARQTDSTWPESLWFATSAPGAISMSCGYKYASVEIRLERWDSQPPPEDEVWEDCDEVPFESLDGGGPLVAHGFDAEEGAGLDVEHLGRAHGRVLARGRHRYSYSNHPRRYLPPEQWLIRLWPDLHRRPHLEGVPRRIAAPHPSTYARSPWAAALHSWNRTGWKALFAGSLDLFSGIAWALERAGAPCPPDQLPELLAAVQQQSPTFDPSLGLSNPIPDPLPLPDVQERRGELMTALTGALDMQILTVGDLLSAMLRLALLTRCDDGRIAPNPAPQPAWEVLDLPPDWVKHLQHQALLEYTWIQGDLLHLMQWAPDQVLHASPQQMAVRLAVSVDDVLGGLRLLHHVQKIETRIDPETISADDRLELALATH